ncbi:MAG: hypothetical protein OHK0046_22010 [Anaerolineae bacterium]
MLILKDAKDEDVIALGRELLNRNRDRLTSFEEAAQAIVRGLYNEVCLPDGDPLFVMLRVFRFGTREDLHPELLPLAQEESEHWLTLMASIGTEPDWCDRRLSQAHRILPADAPSSPMLQAAFQQMGLQFGQYKRNDTMLEMHKHTHGGHMRYFYIPEALGSPFVPAQNDFVIPYHIQSVVGFGSMFVNKTAYFCVGFTRQIITEEEAARFAHFNPFAGTLLALYTRRNIWAG